MNTPFLHANRKPTRFLRVALSLGMSLGAYGALVMPAASLAATQNPVVNQEPLTVAPSVPPNIMLMLDDSGSMSWNFMPDWGYLQNNGNNDAVIDAANNGVYYNPAITYTPPPFSQSGSYASQTDMTNVPEDGFGTRTTQTVNLFTYDGSLDYHDSGGGVANGSAIEYNVSVNSPTSTVYTGVNSSNACKTLQTQKNAVSRSYNSSKKTCTLTFNNYTYYFQYSTGPAAGPYTVHYVANSAADCTKAPSPTNCVASSDTSGVSAPSGVTVSANVANWFAYYHTRILMAKTGLMTGFLGLDSTYRFGFGSINGNANDSLPSPNASFGGKTIAEVQPFGDGSGGTQKANFWSWVAAESPNGSTPLRAALGAVGQYYQNAQPWTSMTGDPGYVAGGSNTPLACRASYTILTTDGFWNGGYTSSTIAGTSGKAGTTVTGPNGESYTYSPAAPYSGGGTGISNSPSLADVALYYWENDLQPSINNEVPTAKPEDPAFWQHMTTFTMGLGFVPQNISPSGTTINQIFSWANGGAAIGGFSWPTPAGAGGSGGSINNIADLAHAAVNGHGDFFSATSPQSFTAGIEAALGRVGQRTGTGASLSANSTSLTTGTVIYQANYFTSVWKGDLSAYSVDSVTGAINPNPTWQAAQKMPSAGSRDIETYNPSTGTFVPFQNGSGTPPSLDSAQLAALGSSSTDQQNMVNYLRGDSSGEEGNGGSFRTRTTALGDIVNSQPVYSGPPDSNEFINQSFLGNIVDPGTGTIPFYDWAVGTTSGGTFTASAASTRTPLIFVDANDGMLHAFNASTGVEVYAYLPGAVIAAGLSDLSNPAYGTSADPHQFYNDGQLTIADAYIQTAGESAPSWHTILVGTTGKGLAEAVFALDVTDPSNIQPLWERSAGDGLTGSNYIGQMVGKPVIAQTNYTPAGGGVAGSSAWSVLIGNGFNSAAGVSALLQFNLATGALSVHATTDTTAGNGLAAPVAWMDTPTNGVADIAYAGDLHGNVWSFALNDATGSNPTPTSTGSLLFVAKDSGNKIQPITAGMLAGKDPSTGDVWLFFGTGEYLNSSDLTDLDTQSWYGIIVQSSDATLVSNLANGRSALVQRTITAQTAGNAAASPPVLPARSISAEVTNPDGTTDMTGKSGWYLDLQAPGSPSSINQGERVVDSNQFQGSLLVGVTRIPQVTDVCNPSGSGWIMAVDPFTGAPPSSDFFDINGDGFTNSGDRVNGNVAAGVGFGSLPNAPIFVGGIMETSFDNGTTASIKTAGSVGGTKRVSWRELVNP